MDHLLRQNNPLRVPKPTPLAYDVHDLNGKFLVKQGELFSTRLLQKMSRMAPPPNKKIRMRDHAVFGKDLLQAINKIPFHPLFSQNFSSSPFEKVLHEAGLPYWGIQALEYFKKMDPDTYWHSLRVFVLTAFMSLQFIKQQKRKLLVASMGPLHDIGKFSVPLKVLQKKTLLSLEERNHIRYHVFSGAVLLSYYQGTENPFGAKVALEHHERLDGSGYPFGILLSDPMVELIALCDVYDALISPRPYRNRAYDLRSGLEVLTEMAMDGTFSLDLVRFLIALHRQEKTDYKKLALSKEIRGLPPEKNYYGQMLS
ncbi:MAG: hypothetical protein A2Y79_00985 [Deltaproteobacteria bacterium RBG_13_43_22]|nr:MAG: hypothetical protein A2Y79_00985 [Deltaproteobacteria bacterium RBG_13_43_22]